MLTVNVLKRFPGKQNAFPAPIFLILESNVYPNREGAGT